MFKNIKMIYFDLDHTLWDFEKNSRVCLGILYDKYLLKSNIDKNYFIDVYEKNNDILWEMYRKREIEVSKLKLKRFENTLDELNYPYENNLIKKLNENYINLLAEQDKTFDGTHEVLKYLKSKYEIGIITNGFKEIQFKKLKSANLDNFFKIIITSDSIGIPKPDKKIFDYAAKLSGFNHNEILYIGDDLQTDVISSKKAGFESIWFNYKKKNTSEDVFQIHSLLELLNLL
ncbi:noncanonical pyrimidine nucleotidase, YjjG family protein [Tepiditoga spiralis]|uniref:Noncanonical pyrimidine nucleotidase, YjjG family protein n=1 Tax=Tepiditoga spiralis TaxID=2108365 RepID=A0A7G1G8F6_9BACT|nr:YjjG family noncanonical pyrimidine nucleotidase [Tepiditoga spiralis]BBE31514.1 noncanonical pyrimidine nucleotidase, YjjG family protein [Tepiditoga spiralis]